MDILVTFDKNYINPFKTMVKSIVFNNNLPITFWLIHSEIEQVFLDDLEEFCDGYGANFNHIPISKKHFKDAKSTQRYPQEMYYRLLAPIFLPKKLDKILYLDSDTLIINSLDELWDIQFPEGTCYAAASHNIIGNITDNINKLRLDTDHSYYNTGVILMNLKKAREIVDMEEVISNVNSSKDIELILPDQDVFNTMYGKYTIEIPDEIYNYDVRHYLGYLIKSSNEYDLDWIMSNTCILHFCGKKKPWLPQGYNIFTSLYKYFMYK